MMNAQRVRVISLHVAAWATYIFLYSTLWRENSDTFAASVTKQLWLLPQKLFLVYFTLVVLVPNFLRTRRYGYFLLSLVLLSIAGGIINQLMVHFVIPSSVDVVDKGEYFWDIERISKRMTYLNSPLLFALTVEVIRMWYEQKEINTRLTKEKIAAELAMLKSQLQPHFFFNTLNNLYSLTLQKSDLAPELILKLSGLMRYILDDSGRDFVPLKDEVEFIKEYIAIEMVRYSEKVSVSTQWPENMNGYTVPPLSLFTFVENAFKHGVANETETAFINITVNVSEKGLTYGVRNSCPVLKNGVAIKNGAGIGLRNTEERLKITYSSDIKFVVQRNGDNFEASFSIPSSRS